MFSMQEYEKIKKNMVSGMTIDLLHLNEILLTDRQENGYHEN